MKRLVLVAMLVGGVLGTASRLGAQDCSNLTNWDLRGTYTFWGNGWMDLSKTFDKSLPAGYSPLAFVQAFTFDGKGGGTGWISGNAGGVQFDAQMKWTYDLQADCSIRGTQSLKKGGVWAPPISVMWVISNIKGTSLETLIELTGFIRGEGPGSQVPHGTARRISMNYQ